MCVGECVSGCLMRLCQDMGGLSKCVIGWVLSPVASVWWRAAGVDCELASGSGDDCNIKGHLVASFVLAATAFCRWLVLTLRNNEHFWSLAWPVPLSGKRLLKNNEFCFNWFGVLLKVQVGQWVVFMLGVDMNWWIMFLFYLVSFFSLVGRRQLLDVLRSYGGCHYRSRGPCPGLRHWCGSD